MKESIEIPSQVTPKVLSFYLPQFYPIPLNDEWHGKGFTEWTRVTASKPKYSGHDQPRVPHADIGHYRLDNPEILRKQASLMERGGVYGQIFYHYWFGGTQILEKPAQILLENPDIPMNFCFCWANESWSRKWDGGAGEVILDQDYSLSDAENFIKYLIPFFRDSRYVKVAGRPVLFVYRTSDIPGLGFIVETWNAICSAAGLLPPYLITIQTGDTFDAANSGFSAEAERPIYHMQELENLPRFQSIELNNIKGQVIEYEDVVNLYTNYTRRGHLPVIPGLVVSWDPSPRHGTNTLILKGRSPELYREWLIDALRYSSSRFAQEEAFVVINAWNEWAEGAYLEPDNSHGYEFLDVTREAQEIFTWDVK
jgi:hypothetical protein